jgi:hypothetical protein
MADHVVGKGESHQQQEYQSPAALQPDLPQFGDRATGRTLEQIIQQHPPIEHGDRQQVQHAETQADHRQKIHEPHEAEVGRLRSPRRRSCPVRRWPCWRPCRSACSRTCAATIRPAARSARHRAAAPRAAPARTMLVLEADAGARHRAWPPSVGSMRASRRSASDLACAIHLPAHRRGVPPAPLATIAARSGELASSTGLPSMRSTRSPTCRPEFAAAPSGSDVPMRRDEAEAQGSCRRASAPRTDRSGRSRPLSVRVVAPPSRVTRRLQRLVRQRRLPAPP